MKFFNILFRTEGTVYTYYIYISIFIYSHVLTGIDVTIYLRNFSRKRYSYKKELKRSLETLRVRQNNKHETPQLSSTLKEEILREETFAVSRFLA